MSTPSAEPIAEDDVTTLLSLIRDLAVELNPGYQSSRPVSLDDSLDRDLGFGSLGRAELFARIER
ncbi:MAG: hypothetical protein OEU36_22825, partial [Gammaproteobacteria bacterium]|nr:hypothetical protein [Gammaproteobacteria bacterium]